MILLIALLAGTSRYIYLQKAPLLIPDDLPTGPDGAIDQASLRQMMRGIGSLAEVFRYIIELLLFAVLVFTAGKVTTGGGNIRKFIAQIGLAYTPLLLQQLLRIIYTILTPVLVTQNYFLSHEEIEAAALQYVRKISGYRKPSRANQSAFEQAVAAIAAASQSLLRKAQSHATTVMEILLLFSLAGAAVFTLVTGVWLASLYIQNASIIDIFWGLGFVTLSWIYFLGTPDGYLPRKLLICGMTLAWGLRLSLYIFLRNHSRPEDFRYRAWRAAAGKYWWWQSYFKVFLLQGFLMWLISPPLLAAQAAATPARLTWLDFAGLGLWVFG